MGSLNAAVCYVSQYDSICPSLGANPRLCNWQTHPRALQKTLNALRIMWYRWLQPFHEHFTALRHSYFTQRLWTLFHGCVVQSLCAITHWSLLTLFCFKSVFLTAICPHRPALQSVLHTEHVETFFYVIGSVEQWCLEKLAFCHGNWWHWWNCLQHL